MIKLVTYFFQSIIIYFLFFCGLVLGMRISRKFFGFLFLLVGPIFKSNKIINKNLKIFSTKISEIEKKRIITGMWKNFGKTFIEYIFLNRLRKSNSHITILGEENLKEIINKNKSCIFVSGHFANFELMSMEMTKKNIKLATIYRPLNNIFLNPFMEFLRKKYVCNNQIKKGINGVREAIGYIKKNYSIALMIDQRVSEGEKISFFGKDAFTTTLPAQLSMKFNLSIVPVFIQRKNNDSFEIEFKKPIDSKKFKDKIKISEELNKILEKMIIKNPDQWIWTHNRWK